VRKPRVSGRVWLAPAVTLATLIPVLAAVAAAPRTSGAAPSGAAVADPFRAAAVAHSLRLDRDELEFLGEQPSTELAAVTTTPPTPAPTPEPTPDPTPQPTPIPTAPPTLRPAARTAAPPPVTAASTRDVELRMLALINGSRTAGGLVAVALDAAVSTTARAHSGVEAQLGYVYHDGPDGTASARNAAACGSGWYGENTGKVWNGNVDALHVEFMSELWAPINHRTITMDPAFRRVGIGVVQGADALYMTMVFCR